MQALGRETEGTAQVQAGCWVGRWGGSKKGYSRHIDGCNLSIEWYSAIRTADFKSLFRFLLKETKPRKRQLAAQIAYFVTKSKLPVTVDEARSYLSGLGITDDNFSDKKCYSELVRRIAEGTHTVNDGCLLRRTHPNAGRGLTCIRKVYRSYSK